MQMKIVLQLLRKLSEEELFQISDAIDIEIERRQERIHLFPDSARRRAVERQQSYRRRNGSTAPPIWAFGLRDTKKRRMAA
jgi:hypothetical protein